MFIGRYSSMLMSRTIGMVYLVTVLLFLLDGNVALGFSPNTCTCTSIGKSASQIRSFSRARPAPARNPSASLQVTKLASLKPPDLDENAIMDIGIEDSDKDGAKRTDRNVHIPQVGESATKFNWQSALKEKLFLGIDPSPEVLSIMAIYFVEGALGLARLAQTFFLKDELHLGPAELSALTGLFTLPWTIKVCIFMSS